MERIEIEGEKIIVEHVSKNSIHRNFLLQENASLKALFIVHDGECVLDVMTVGANSKAHVTCLYISKNKEKIISDVQGKLQADNTSVELYLLSLLGDDADCQVNGGVTIAKETKGSSGHLLEENIVLGKKVKIKTLPMLDVRSSDVSASHGAKIDRLDESKLFYMMAKGLDQKQAQKLIIQGYLERVWNEVTTGAEEKQKEELVSQILGYFGME